MSAIAMTLTGEMSMDMLVSLSPFEAAHANACYETSLDILLEGAIPTPVHMTDSGTSAAQQVLAVTELLELILFSLPVHDLSLCQRTCRSFHRTIRGSCDLKQRLFLEPVNLNNNVLRLNPLLLRLGESTGSISHIYNFVMPEDLERL
ncbi:hypothetical protein DOTSEDRAFT_34836 [Dothistroma septosporum NZE10]|uniref:Uncharacterized protein n=1 Tax=Dothistroma septosporum (strain NZE10 / CBS 128990) TaxID=675120 RepID=N1PM07_DOTSN|nr:hypothetical protein DOTSEDRAFT_34836 [Dothistroma septosporum NZE10]